MDPCSEEARLLFLARNTVLGSSDIAAKNDHYNLAEYYFERQEYVKASQALYHYLSCLKSYFVLSSSGRGALSRDMVLLIWTECLKVSLLSLSCIRLVKPNVQWFLYHPTPDSSAMIGIQDLVAENLRCKATMAILATSDRLDTLFYESMLPGILFNDTELIKTLEKFGSFPELCQDLKHATDHFLGSG